MIRLGIDSREMFAPAPRGTGKAMRELVRHLVPLARGWSFLLYTNRPGDLALPGTARSRRIDIRGDRWDLWERIRLPLAALTDRVHLLHCPAQTAPPIVPCPVVLTVHDLIPIRTGDGLGREEIRRFRRSLARSVRTARRIITVSDYTRRDLLAEFPMVADKVDVVHWGVTATAPPDAETWQRFIDESKLRGPFFVAFGGDAPRKNVPRILEALAQFRRAVTADVQLVLVGVPGRARQGFADLADRLSVSKHVVLLGYVDDGIVGGLLARAEALVYPSLYEGFGLPVLEAMAAGAPVIASDVTSLPEVAGDAALLVDPTRAEALVEAMRSCYLDEAVKQDLRARGLRRVQAFTWEQAARRTLASYERAVGGSHGA